MKNKENYLLSNSDLFNTDKVDFKLVLKKGGLYLDSVTHTELLGYLKMKYNENHIYEYNFSDKYNKEDAKNLILKGMRLHKQFNGLDSDVGTIDMWTDWLDKENERAGAFGNWKDKKMPLFDENDIYSLELTERVAGILTTADLPKFYFTNEQVLEYARERTHWLFWTDWHNTRLNNYNQFSVDFDDSVYTHFSLDEFTKICETEKTIGAFFAGHYINGIDAGVSNEEYNKWLNDGDKRQRILLKLLTTQIQKMKSGKFTNTKNAAFYNPSINKTKEKIKQWKKDNRERVLLQNKEYKKSKGSK